MTRAWLRVEVRRRWRSLVVLGLLIALSTGTVLAAVAGARRGASTVDRLLDTTLPATAVARVNRVGFDWTPVRSLPEVAALSTFTIWTGFDVAEAPSDPVGAYIPADVAAMRTIERPVILSGRLADPRRADEAVVTQGFVDRYGRGVGSTVTVRLFSLEQMRTGVASVHQLPPVQPQGPAVRTQIVGVIRSPWFSDVPGEPGRLFPSPGLFAAYPAGMTLGPNQPGDELWAMVRLVHGESDLPAFQADLARLAGRPDVDLLPRSEALKPSRDAARFEAQCLLVFAIVALLAAVVLVGQAIARYTAASVADLQGLRALGLTRGQAVAAAVTGPAIAAIGGAAGGLVLAFLTSGWMPFGPAAFLEPAPGMTADWLVFALGGVTVVALVVAAAAATAWLVLPGRTRRPQTRASTVARAAGNAGLPVPVVVGTRLALQPGPSAGAARSALGGAVVAVLGVLAALTFAAGVADGVTNPARHGQLHQVETGLGFGGMNLTGLPLEINLATLTADPDVTGALYAPYASAEAGHRFVMTFSFGPRAGWPGMVLIAGVPPRTRDEVVLAPTTARQLGARVGSVISFSGQSGTAGDSRHLTVRVTGLGFVPHTDHNDYDSGAWLTPEGYRTLFGEYFLQAPILLIVRPGADPAVVAPRLADSLAAAGAEGAVFVSGATAPTRLWTLRDIRVLPFLLGAFLAVVAAGSLGHALLLTVRRRAPDLAVLRALGLTRPQSRAVIATQAMIVALVGLVLGVPLGLAAGRVTWRLVADATPLAFHAPSASTAVLAAGAAVLVGVQLIAVPALRRVARLRIAETLRAE